MSKSRTTGKGCEAGGEGIRPLPPSPKGASDAVRRRI